MAITRIEKPVTFTGSQGTTTVTAIIDTGATTTLLPRSIAADIGTHATGFRRWVGGIAGGEDMEFAIAGVTFPTLGKGNQILVAISDNFPVPLIGMDVMSPMGITIDTESGEFKLNNKLWEAFKTVSAVVVAGGGAVAVISAIGEALSTPAPKRRRSRTRR